MFNTPTLALDYGRQRIGIAISKATLAEPLTILQNDDQFLDTLQQIIKDHAIAQLLVGLSENEMAQESKHFGQKLTKYFQLPVFYTDETLSSVEVRSRLAQRDQGKQKYKGPIDHYAAAHFLQKFIDEGSHA